MTTLSVSTLGLLIEIADKAFTASELKNLLMRSNLWQYGQGGPNKPEMLRSAFLGACDQAEQGDQQAHRGLLKFVLLLVEERVGNPERPHPVVRFNELREALLADGYQLHWEHEPDPTNPFFGGTYRFQLLPTDAAPVPLAPEIGALEAELRARGYNDALNHYQQAHDNLLHHNYEAANGQLRTALEDLVTRLARQHTGYVGQGRPGEGGNAINHMVDTGSLRKDDGGLLLQGIWRMTHTKGSHPGQSDAGEARFRMLIITAIARFLLNRFS
jgi:hypothetical protein